MKYVRKVFFFPSPYPHSPPPFFLSSALLNNYLIFFSHYNAYRGRQGRTGERSSCVVEMQLKRMVERSRKLSLTAVFVPTTTVSVPDAVVVQLHCTGAEERKTLNQCALLLHLWLGLCFTTPTPWLPLLRLRVSCRSAPISRYKTAADNYFFFTSSSSAALHCLTLLFVT